MIIWPLNVSDVHVVAVESNFWLNFVRCRFYTASPVCSMSKDSLKENIYVPVIDRKAHKVPRNRTRKALLQAPIRCQAMEMGKHFKKPGLMSRLQNQLQKSQPVTWPFFTRVTLKKFKPRHKKEIGSCYNG